MQHAAAGQRRPLKHAACPPPLAPSVLGMEVGAPADSRRSLDASTSTSRTWLQRLREDGRCSRCRWCWRGRDEDDVVEEKMRLGGNGTRPWAGRSKDSTHTTPLLRAMPRLCREQRRASAESSAVGRLKRCGRRIRSHHAAWSWKWVRAGSKEHNLVERLSEARGPPAYGQHELVPAGVRNPRAQGAERHKQRRRLACSAAAGQNTASSRREWAPHPPRNATARHKARRPCIPSRSPLRGPASHSVRGPSVASRLRGIVSGRGDGMLPRRGGLRSDHMFTACPELE